MSDRGNFFDLDSTLTDPTKEVSGCAQYALGQMGEPVPSKNVLRWCVGPSLVENSTKLVGADRAAEDMSCYCWRFSTLGLFENADYAGIPEVPSQIAAEYPLYVASSTPLVFVD